MGGGGGWVGVEIIRLKAYSVQLDKPTGTGTELGKNIRTIRNRGTKISKMSHLEIRVKFALFKKNSCLSQIHFTFLLHLLSIIL